MPVAGGRPGAWKGPERLGCVTEANETAFVCGGEDGRGGPRQDGGGVAAAGLPGRGLEVSGCASSGVGVLTAWDVGDLNPRQQRANCRTGQGGGPTALGTAGDASGAGLALRTDLGTAGGGGGGGEVTGWGRWVAPEEGGRGRVTCRRTRAH